MHFARGGAATTSSTIGRVSPSLDAPSNFRRRGRPATDLDLAEGSPRVGTARRGKDAQASARLPRDDHGPVDDASLLDHHLIVQNHGAVAHWDIIVSSRVALAAALGVGAGRKQEIARE